MASSKVLIVEDNRIVAEDLQTSLEKLGFDVTGIVSDGSEALGSVKEKMPDLVLMDIVLRGEMDGIATAEQIKTRFNVPVVYLTAHSEEAVFERAKSTDPFGYVVKPFTERELDIAVQMALYKHKLGKQLKTSKDTFHNIVNLNTDGIVVLDKDKIVRFLNPAACHLLGGKADDFYNNVFRYSFEPGAANDVVIQNIDGRMLDVEISATATRWQEDEAFLLTLRNVTQKKQTQKALKESEKRFRGVIENIPICILIVQNDKLVYQNPQQTKLFGALAAPIGFDNFLEYIHPDDRLNVKVYLLEILSRKSKFIDKAIRLYPLGKRSNETEMKWMQCVATLIEYRDHEAVLLSMVDITQAKEFEHMIIIREKMASLGHVAAGMAHEIRNPLSGITLLLSALMERFKDKENPSEILGLIEEAQEAAYKIDSVIKRVGDFARPGPLQLACMDINDTIDAAAKLSGMSLKKAGILLEKQLAENLPEVFIDCHLLEQVLLNLFVNAIEILKDKSGIKKIRVISSSDDEYVHIKVSDSGPGVPDEIKRKIFDPFFTTKKNGSGIGLSICQRIITDHGGGLEISDSAGGGAEFCIRIPKERASF